MTGTLTKGEAMTKLSIEGTYQGKEIVGIESKRVETISGLTEQPLETTVTNTAECYKIEHHIIVNQDDLDVLNADWCDITVWIPTGELESSESLLGVCAKMDYIDSNKNSSVWSYLVTEAMENEVANPSYGSIVEYAPCLEGELYGFNEFALSGLYGWTWQVFGAFAEGGEEFLDDKKWSMDNEQSNTSLEYECCPVKEYVGELALDAWRVNVAMADQSTRIQFEASLCSDFPIPTYVSVTTTSDSGETSDEGFASAEYILMDVDLGGVEA